MDLDSFIRLIIVHRSWKIVNMDEIYRYVVLNFCNFVCDLYEIQFSGSKT